MNILEKVWPEWKIEKEIGRGSYGVVYKCVKEDKRHKEYAAVKVISVPRDEYEMEDVVSEKMTQEQSKAYYKDIADDLLKEIEILKSLKGTKNIVEIYDAKVVEKDDGIGWNIFISMEMLTDFTSYSSDKKFTQEDVIKLGSDLCSALSVCHKSRIIHRDIKPENIFVDEYGNYKLGDFGVAKQMEKTKGSVSVKGTYGYMSPEVFSGKKCDGRADLYSLALVMYKLLNNNRFPFIDADKQIVKYSERQQAFERRIKGESIPAIKGVSSELNEVILKACSYKSVDRQKNIDEFRKQLELVGKGKKSGKKVKIAIAVATFVAVLISAIVGIALFKDNGNEEPVAELPPVKEVKELNNVSSVGKVLDPITIGLSEYKEYLIQGKGENEGNVYRASFKDVTVLENLIETLSLKETYEEYNKTNAGNEPKDGVLAFDGHAVYYTKNGRKTLCKYDMESPVSGEYGEESKKYYQNFYIDSVVYFDDDYIYVCVSEIDSDGQKKLLHILNDVEVVDDYAFNNLFEYNGYIIFDSEDENGSHIQYHNARTYEDGKPAIPVCQGDLSSGIYGADGDMYFIAKDQAGITVKRFNLDSGEEGGTPDIVAKLDDEISTGIWKVTECFNDKMAVICNEAENAKDKWYIWEYENNSLNAIEYKVYADSGDLAELEFFVDELSDEHGVMLSICEGNFFRVYEVSSNGAITPVGENFYVEKKGDDCYRVGTEFFNIQNQNRLVNIKLDSDYVKKEETLYANKNYVPVYLAPSVESLDDEPLHLNDKVEKLGEINGVWSKVIVKNKIRYIESVYLENLEYSESDIEKLVAQVNGNNSDYNMISYDYIMNGPDCKLYIEAIKIGPIPYKMKIKVEATLEVKNGAMNWNVTKIEGKIPPKEISEYRPYVKTEKFNKNDYFSHFAVYDINHDGVYELIAYKDRKNMKDVHGVYTLKKGQPKILASDDKNKIYTVDFELYEFNNTLCYFKDGIKNAQKSDGINLVLVDIVENELVKTEIVYKGSIDNIVKVESYSLEKSDDILY